MVDTLKRLGAGVFVLVFTLAAYGFLQDGIHALARGDPNYQKAQADLDDAQKDAD